jgi:peptide/nickel transport system ATP-binding protein
LANPLLSVRDLRTYFDEDGRVVRAVDGVSFDINRGETLGIVGESGSGKSVTNLSIMRLVPIPPGRIASGEIIFGGKNLLSASEAEMRAIRGKRIAMIFQDPMTSLNPFLRISTQLMEVTELHLGHTKEQARAQAIQMLEIVGIPDAARRIDNYPHQFSGGMRQRVMIAMALSCQPELLIADEPTTALDVTIQAQILDLIQQLKQTTDASVIMITHDLGVVAGMTNRIVVMYAGRVMEIAPTPELFAKPGNPYTKGLLLSVPDPTAPSQSHLYQIPGLPPDVARLPPGCPFAPRCYRVEDICRREDPPFVELAPGHHSLCHFAREVFQEGQAGRAGQAGLAGSGQAGQPHVGQARLAGAGQAHGAAGADANTLITVTDLKVHFDLGGGSVLDRLTGGQSIRQVVRAVDGVSFSVRRGETLGLVGESGCGKTTLGRAILRLTEPTGGKVQFGDLDLTTLSPGELRRQRRHLQMIFQDPYASLDPRMTIGQIIAEPIETFGLSKGRAKEERVRELMQTVGLSARFINRYPHEFSGGQQQRIGIARALATDPDFIVADEPISALDVSIQAQIINLIEQLQQERNLTYVFISHDLRAIRHTSDRVAVMYLGEIVELGDAREVYASPLMPYTKALISAVPVPDPTIEATRRRIVLQGDVPSPINPPSGCRFHTRCGYAVPACSNVRPQLVEIKPLHFAACIRISPAEPEIERVAPGATPGLQYAASPPAS